VIVVENPTKVVEAEVAGEGSGFRRDAFHHAAVATHSENVVNEDIGTGLV